MNYEEALGYLEGIYRLGSILGLEKEKILMEKLDNPQNKIRTIHIAGTNGKGSTCAMLSSVLIEAGYKTGVYTSPHLENYNERYTINNERINNDDFARHVTIIKEKCDEMGRDGYEQPTVFEVVTALAFTYFLEKQVDFLLVEVGLGGRHDATNIIKSPEISIITSIGIDHMDFLGDTIEKIAAEKAGIIKKDRPVVTYNQCNSVFEVIKKASRENNSKLYYSKKDTINIIKQDVSGTVFSLKNDYLNFENIEIGMLGEYQIKNTTTVLLAVKALSDIGINISEEAVYKGLKKARWSGRMEICSQNPLILLDGAHNIDGINMLSKSIKKYFTGKDITLLIGILGDKEYEKMMEVLTPLASKIVLTEPNNSRTWDINKLTETIKSYNEPIYREKDIKKAFSLAKSITDSDAVLCCAGSLYLIGEIYALINK